MTSIAAFVFKHYWSSLKMNHIPQPPIYGLSLLNTGAPNVGPAMVSYSKDLKVDEPAFKLRVEATTSHFHTPVNNTPILTITPEGVFQWADDTETRLITELSTLPLWLQFILPRLWAYEKLLQAMK
jgi:hypothetical protein